MDANYSTHSGFKHHRFVGSASYQDPQLMEVSSSSGWNSAQQNCKLCQFVREMHLLGTISSSGMKYLHCNTNEGKPDLVAQAFMQEGRE